MYRQSVTVEELNDRGVRVGDYREVREVIFSPARERIEQLVGVPASNLKRLVLTEEDFRDIRDVQPFVLTEDELWNYDTRFRGEENIDDVDCWVLEVRPKRMLEGMRLFEGMLWIGKQDYGIVRLQGQAVPPVYRNGKENLFPHFTTLRKQIDGRHWFPIFTYGDDTLPFRTGPQRIRLTIRYMNYRRFGADSTVKFGKP